jgi:hypothetical protein
MKKSIILLALLFYFVNNGVCQKSSYLGVYLSAEFTNVTAINNADISPSFINPDLMMKVGSGLGYLRYVEDKNIVLYGAMEFSTVRGSLVLNDIPEDYLSLLFRIPLQFGVFKDNESQKGNNIRTAFMFGPEVTQRIKTKSNIDDTFLSNSILGFGMELSNSIFRLNNKIPITYGIKGGLSLYSFEEQSFDVLKNNGYMYSNVFIRFLF